MVKTPCTFAVECLSSVLAGELRGHKPRYMAKRRKKKQRLFPNKVISTG